MIHDSVITQFPYCWLILAGQYDCQWYKLLIEPSMQLQLSSAQQRVRKLSVICFSTSLGLQTETWRSPYFLLSVGIRLATTVAISKENKTWVSHLYAGDAQTCAGLRASLCAERNLDIVSASISHHFSSFAKVKLQSFISFRSEQTLEMCVFIMILHQPHSSKCNPTELQPEKRTTNCEAMGSRWAPVIIHN